MVDSEYSKASFKSLKICNGATIKKFIDANFVLYHLNTKKMCNHSVKKLPFIIRYARDRCKTQEMWDKVFLENSMH